LSGRATLAAASDEELMRAVQANDARAFGELYDRHAARAWRVARAVCHDTSRAEDAVQEGFLSAWQSQASYRREMGSVQSWLMTIIRNRTIDFIRREAAAHRPPVAEGEYIGPDPAGGSLHDEVIARSDADALRATLQQLPGPQAEVIALAYYGELSHTEIATRLRLPKGTVKGRIRLGLEKLREQLESPGCDGYRSDLSLATDPAGRGVRNRLVGSLARRDVCRSR
jgi:RNA polymerase sigma-70 factor (ECF subfamily)